MAADVGSGAACCRMALKVRGRNIPRPVWNASCKCRRNDNWIVANCSTPANYFHILRRQMHRDFRKPLILMTPKSLLRHPMCVSDAADFTNGSTFHRVLWDDAQKGHSDLKLKADDKIKRVVLCSGKVYYDLLAERDARGLDDVYLLRVEQLYPFPTQSLMTRNLRFKGAEMVWCQEEPKNRAPGPSSNPTSNGC